MVGDGDLQRRFHRFGARIGVENMLEGLGRHVAQGVGQLEGLGMAHLEGGGVIELGYLLLHRLGDARAVVAGVAAPQARCAIQHLSPVGGGVIHAVGRNEHPRRLLELPVRRERHPECRKIVGNALAIGSHVLSSLSRRPFRPGLLSRMRFCGIVLPIGQNHASRAPRPVKPFRAISGARPAGQKRKGGRDDFSRGDFPARG